MKSRVNFLVTDSSHSYPKIYFTTHPADFSACFEETVQDLFRLLKCTIYFDSDPDHPEDAENFVFDLTQMNLIVIPVTWRFLTEENLAFSTVFHTAQKKHIPLLPLLTDASLASLFNEKCGNLQALCPHSQNDTGILYTKKLQNYLEALFPAEQEIQEIRQTFSHCIFLSYRKKDRKHAQALMQVIHENERLVDTAIWYDEFLTPGEDFNASIQNRIEKSDQFVMAMTSHMVCEKNYVQQIEYPFAQSLNKAILPVLVSGDPLDLKRLKDAFPQLPPVYEMNRAALYPPLSSLMGKIEDLDAKRLYCLGLAYLNGIDVEINYEKGVRMIERAAQRDELRAIRKLIAIYEEGLGLPSNLPEAIFWTKRLAALDPCEEAFQKCAELSFKNRQFDQAKEYILDALHILHREKNALHHGQKAMPRSYERQKTDWISLEAALLNLLGDIDLEKDDLEQAEADYKRALQMNYDLVYDLPARPALQSLSHSLLHMGNLYRKLNRSSSAAKCFQRAIEICARMAKDIDMPEILSDLMMALEGMAQVSLHENRRAEARTYARQAVQIAWQTVRRLENGETLSQLTRVVLLQEELFEQDHDWLEAQVCSEEALQASEKGILLARTQRTLTARLNALLSTSRLFKVQGMGKEAEQIGWQATQTARELELVEDRSEAWSQLLKCLRELAEISLIQAKSSQAREYAKEGLKLARKLNRTDASLLSVQYSIFFLSLLGTIPVRCEEISYSVRCCKEAIQLIQDKMPNPEGELLSLLGLLEEQTGNLYRSDSQPEKAADHFQNAYKIQERLLGQKSFQEDLSLLDDLVFLLDSMAGQKHQVNPSEPYVPSDRRRLSEDTSSRQALCAQAMARLQDKLVEIYQGGKNNMEQTIEARQKAFEARKQAARLEPNQSSLHNLAFSANELRRFYTSRHDFEQALYYGEVCAAAAGELVKLAMTVRI